MLESVITHLANERSVDEKLKDHDMLRWDVEMKNIKASAEKDSRTNSKEMKKPLGYMSRHHDDWRKTYTMNRKGI